MSKVWPDETSKIIELIQPFLDKWLSSKKIAWIIWDSRNYVDESLETEDKYSIFWTPDKKQKEMIDWFDEEFRQKMIDIKLKYKKNTTELEIDWERIILDKEQPIQEEMIWEDSMKAIDDLDWRKWVNEDLMAKLLIIFKWNAEVIWLNSTNNYWSSTAYTDNSAPYAWAGYFSYGYVFHNLKTNNLSTICIHN